MAKIGGFMVNKNFIDKSGADSGGPHPVVARLNELLETLTCDIISFKARATLIHAGEMCERLYMLRSGWVHRFQLLPDGRKQIFCFFTAGDLVSPSLIPTPYSHFTISALVEEEALVIDRAALIAAMAEDPSAMEAVLAALAYRQRYVDERMVELGRLTAYERMCVLICRLANKLTPTNHILQVPLTRDLISDALGITSVHVSRTLKTLEDEGLVRWNRQALEILDLAKIRAATPRSFMVQGADSPYLL